MTAEMTRICTFAILLMAGTGAAFSIADRLGLFGENGGRC